MDRRTQFALSWDDPTMNTQLHVHADRNVVTDMIAVLSHSSFVNFGMWTTYPVEGASSQRFPLSLESRSETSVWWGTHYRVNVSCCNGANANHNLQLTLAPNRDIKACFGIGRDNGGRGVQNNVTNVETLLQSWGQIQFCNTFEQIGKHSCITTAHWQLPKQMSIQGLNLTTSETLYLQLVKMT